MAHGGLKVEHANLEEGGEGLGEVSIGRVVEGVEPVAVLVGHGGRVIPVIAEVPVEALGEAHDVVRVEMFVRGRPWLVGLEARCEACVRDTRKNNKAEGERLE